MLFKRPAILPCRRQSLASGAPHRIKVASNTDFAAENVRTTRIECFKLPVRASPSLPAFRAVSTSQHISCRPRLGRLLRKGTTLLSNFVALSLQDQCFRPESWTRWATVIACQGGLSSPPAVPRQTSLKRLTSMFHQAYGIVNTPDRMCLSLLCQKISTNPNKLH